MKRFGAIALVVAGFIAGITFTYNCGGSSSSAADTSALEARIEALEYTLSCAYMTTATINGVAGPHFIFNGVNLHVQNGLAQTDTNNGLGNLIIGYNEGSQIDTTQRTGSHNLVIGPQHRYTAFGGLVAGYQSLVTGNYSSVSGGGYNTASGINSSVSGGHFSAASGFTASVSGGYVNTASGNYSSVSGGDYNTASGLGSSVSGGEGNSALGESSSVSGGYQRSAVNIHDWWGGGLVQTQ